MNFLKQTKRNYQIPFGYTTFEFIFYFNGFIRNFISSSSATKVINWQYSFYSL